MLRRQTNLHETPYSLRSRRHFRLQRLLERGLRRNRAHLNTIVGQLRAGDVFVDVGANCGLYRLFAAKAVGASGCVLAVEPAPEMTRRLRFNPGVEVRMALLLAIVQATNVVRIDALKIDSRVMKIEF